MCRNETANENRAFSRVFEVKLKVCLREPAESWRTLTYPQTTRSCGHYMLC